MKSEPPFGGKSQNQKIIKIQEISLLSKVLVFYEVHKKLQNLHRQFDLYLVSVKSMMKILKFCVAFLANMNFNIKLSWMQNMKKSGPAKIFFC